MTAPREQDPAADLATLRAFDAADPTALDGTLAALARLGGERFDPPRMRYIESLAEKAATRPAPVAAALGAKARTALAGYLTDYLAARERAAQRLSRMPRSGALDALFEAGDFAALARQAARHGRAAQAQSGPLTQLCREIRHGDRALTEAPDASFEDVLRRQEQALIGASAGAGFDPAAASAAIAGPDGIGELRAMRQVRASLTRRQAQRRLDATLQAGPENPGPLNAEALIVRSLTLMRDISPAYARRLVAYLDTLFRLEAPGPAAAPAKPKGGGRRKG